MESYQNENVHGIDIKSNSKKNVFIKSKEINENITWMELCIRFYGAKVCD